MPEWLTRTEMLLGTDALKKLASSRVAVFGIGGVGGYVAEALVRCGICAIDIIDDDKVCLSNINRQIFALHSTVGMMKTQAAEERLLDINPNVKIYKHNVFYSGDTSDKFDFTLYDYVVDAVDTVSAKLELAKNAQNSGTPIISSMGAGNKLDASMFEVCDIYETSVCPLARVMRRECRKIGIRHLKCVYSKEKAISPRFTAADFGDADDTCEHSIRRQTPASISFVPSAAGLIIAGEVVKDLINL